MIGCPKCSKENQDHYKFCLGCGAELPRDTAPKAFSPQTPPQGMKAASGRPAAAAAPVAMGGIGGGLSGGGAIGPVPGVGGMGAPAPTSAPTVPQGQGNPPPGLGLGGPGIGAQPVPTAGPPSAAVAGTGGDIVMCPQCNHQNTTKNIFCGSCGFRLGGAPPRVSAAGPAAPVAQLPGSILLTALRADGSEAGNYNLPGGTVTLGRDTGSIFSGDSYLSPRHATFRQPTGQLFVKDEASLNGVYKKLQRDAPVEVKPNDVFRIGQEIIRFEPLTPLEPSPDGVERLGAPSKGYVGRIALIIGRDTTGNAFPVPEAGVHLGRERGDVLFPEDGYVSGLHCHLQWDGSRLTLTDLGSSNGTFIRIREEVEVVTGDVLLMGQQLFRITM
ncbi:MAG: domain containing protein [Myxococcaceae bacterium]|nr:domain containing protein [Myxococcaceae bacterium]